MKIAAFATCLLLSGCAHTFDVVNVGPDRFQVAASAAPARGGIAGAQTMATKAAAEKCASLGKQVNVVGVETGHDYPAAGRAVVTFECQ